MKLIKHEESSVFYIYKITNKINGKVYIGQTNNPDRRWKSHKKHSSSIPLQKDIEKYGIDKFEFELLEEENDPIMVNIMEINCIKQYRYGGMRYNTSPGGQLVLTKRYGYCERCGKRLNFGEELGIIAYNVDNTNTVTEIAIICKDTCDDMHFKYFSELEPDAFGELIFDRNVPEEFILKYMLVDGKMDVRFAYYYFIKKMGYE